jgi:ABC-type amino acid transport substrate-binding protein
VADSSVNTTPRWGSWDFGPTGGTADAQAAGEIQDSGTGLAKAEHDLSGVHVHLDPARPAQNPVTAGASDAAQLETPAHSVSRTTQWGSFGGWDRPAAALTTDPAAVADAGVANMVSSAGSGLSQAERDLSQIHVRPLGASHVDLVPGSSDNLLPDRSVGGFDLTPPSATTATPIPASRPTLAARLPVDYTDRTYVGLRS